jgi:nucleoside-diphosphate-sugar epimerase
MMLKGKMPLLPRGAVSPIVDVRDLADVIARGLEAGRPGSYAVAAYRPSIRQVVRYLEECTDRRLPNVPIPDVVARSVGRIADLVQRIVPGDIPIRGSTMRELTAMPVIDNTPAIHALGFAPRPLEETLVDTVRWLAQAGHITHAEAGRLAPDPILPA